MSPLYNIMCFSLRIYIIGIVVCKCLLGEKQGSKVWNNNEVKRSAICSCRAAYKICIKFPFYLINVFIKKVQNFLITEVMYEGVCDRYLDDSEVISREMHSMYEIILQLKRIILNIYISIYKNRFGSPPIMR